ncbi:MAG: aminopeptidase [Gemmatimonadota bacterium]|nr:aminopeptidase [Gemmatimonadota bacterium]
MRVLRLLLRLLLVLVVAAVAYLAIAPTGRYLLRAGWEEGKILWHRRPITAMIADSTTPPAIRAKLRVVLAARAFAQDSLGLAAKQSFTTYSQLQHDTLVLVLSGAYRDRLQPVTWWFPIVGRVPYKGYFDFAAAQAAARRLAADGYDAYVRPSPAFSTLGFFNDPLLSTSLDDDSLDLANTVIHELTHNTFYASGQADFNESFANFAGARGAERFFRSRGDTLAARATAERWGDEKILGRFWSALYQSLDSAYRAHPDSRDARIAAHDSVYARARETLITVVGPQLRTIDTRYLGRARLDNAAVLAQRIYTTDLDDFDAVYDAEGRDARRAIARIIAIAKSRPGDPFGALRDWVSAHGGVVGAAGGAGGPGAAGPAPAAAAGKPAK